MNTPEYTAVWITDLLLDPDYRFLKVGENRQEGDEVIVPFTELQVKVRKWDRHNGSLVQTKNDLPARRKIADCGEEPINTDDPLALSKAVVKFNLAQQALDKTAQALNAVVQVEMGKCSTNNDLLWLVDQLPRNYRGVRRIHEAIICRHDEEQTAEKIGQHPQPA